MTKEILDREYYELNNAASKTDIRFGLGTPHSYAVMGSSLSRMNMMHAVPQSSLRRPTTRGSAFATSLAPELILIDCPFMFGQFFLDVHPQSAIATAQKKLCLARSRPRISFENAGVLCFSARELE